MLDMALPYIVITGPYGAGKTTQVLALKEYLSRRYPELPTFFTKANDNDDPFCMGIHAVVKQGEQKQAVSPLAELLASLAIRAQHTKMILLPRLGSHLVVQNRFIVDGYASHCFARGAMDAYTFKAIADRAVANVHIPELLFYLDVDPEIGTARKVRSGEWKNFDTASLDHHMKVRKGYEDFFVRWPEYNPVRIDSTHTRKERITTIITHAVTGLLRDHYGLRPRR